MDDQNMHAYGEDGPTDAEIGRQWRENSSLEKWFPITAERLAAMERENLHLAREARTWWEAAQTYAADAERLRGALAELLACHTESAGWSMSMLTDRAEFDAMLARSQERLHAAIGAAREALGPNA